MIDDPIDDYLQALIGQALPAAAPGHDAASPAVAADAAQPVAALDAGNAGAVECATGIDQAPAAQRNENARLAPYPASTGDALLDELDAAFDHARTAYENTQGSHAAASTGDALLDELDAAFDQARTAYENTHGSHAAASTGDALLDELDAAFDQARSAYENNQGSHAAASTGDALLDELDAAFDQAPTAYENNQGSHAAASTGDALLDELDAAFDQARTAYENNQGSHAAASTGDALLDELDAAFDQARADYQSGRAAIALTAPQPASTARRIPPAPLGPPVLAARSSPAVPVWQAAGAPAGHAPANHEPRRRASERSSRWLRLRCGQQPYALELLKVQEVVLLAPLLSLRGTAPHMLGIMNLRGQVVPVMDLGLYLGAEPAAEDAATRIVVLESEGQSLGLRVSAVDDVASLSESQIEPPDTARLCRFSNHLFRGVARLGGPPIILLDANALLN